MATSLLQTNMLTFYPQHEQIFLLARGGLGHIASHNGGRSSNQPQLTPVSSSSMSFHRPPSMCPHYGGESSYQPHSNPCTIMMASSCPIMEVEAQINLTPAPSLYPCIIINVIPMSTIHVSSFLIKETPLSSWASSVCIDASHRKKNSFTWSQMLSPMGFF